MTASPVVGVSFHEDDIRGQWVRCLGDLLEGVRVVDVDEVEASAVEVMVVGNPPGRTLVGYEALRFVQSTWAGVDRLLDEIPPVPVARMVAPELTDLMSEFVLAAVLFLHRSFPSYRRSQAERRWHPRPTLAAGARRVGVLGFGQLGRPAALTLKRAGFDVAGWARTSRPGPIPVMAGEDGFRELLGRSDVLVDLLPLTPHTRGILGRSAFELMPRGGALVNAARGAHVVDGELLDALDEGRLSEAVMDVFEEEPLPPDHPFWSHDRITVLPHVAAPSNPRVLAPHVAANIERFLRGETPRFLVAGN